MTDVHALLRGAAEGARVPPLDMDLLRRSARRRRARRRLALASAAAVAVAVPIAVPFAAGSLTGPQDRLAQPAPPPASSAPATDPSAGPSQAPATVEVSLRLLQVVQIDGNWSAPKAVFDRRSVVAGKHIGPENDSFWSVAVAFEPLSVPRGDCVQEAVLTMPPAKVTGGPGGLRVYPSAALSLAAGRLPPAGGRPNTLVDNRPFGAERVHPDGSRSYDVTELVSLWTDGGPFPSQGRSLPPASPIVLLLRPPAADDGSYTRTFDVATSPPVLRTRLSPGCSSR